MKDMKCFPIALAVVGRHLLLLIAVALILAMSGLMPTLAADAQRQVVDANGRAVDVPAKPKRVITLGIRDLDSALALGVKPVGTTAGRGQAGAPHYLADRVADVPVVGQFMQPSLGRIIELQPDLVLAGGIADKRMIEQLSRIAPTVVTYHLDDDWQTAFRRVAVALNRKQAADAYIGHYQARVSELRRELGARKGDTVSIVRWQPRGPSIMLSESFSSNVIGALGLERPASQQQPGRAHTPPLSLESLERIDGDWLFVGTLNGEGASALDTIRERPVFNNLDVVRSGHVVFVDGTLWTSGGGPLAVMAIMDDVQKAMLGS